MDDLDKDNKSESEIDKDGQSPQIAECQNQQMTMQKEKEKEKEKEEESDSDDLDDKHWFLKYAARWSEPIEATGAILLNPVQLEKYLKLHFCAAARKNAK